MADQVGSVVSGKNGFNMPVFWERGSGAVYVQVAMVRKDTGMRVKSAAEALNVAREYARDL